jgi:DNA-binding PadR family transcriptional regulator
MQKMATQPAALTEKESTVLRLMMTDRFREWYGLELVKNSGGALKRGTIYVTLGRLEAKGFLESRKESLAEFTTDSGTVPVIPRRLYKITGLGAKVLDLHEQLARAISLQPA